MGSNGFSRKVKSEVCSMINRYTVQREVSCHKPRIRLITEHCISAFTKYGVHLFITPCHTILCKNYLYGKLHAIHVAHYKQINYKQYYTEELGEISTSIVLELRLMSVPIFCSDNI